MSASQIWRCCSKCARSSSWTLVWTFLSTGWAESSTQHTSGTRKPTAEARRLQHGACSRRSPMKLLGKTFCLRTWGRRHATPLKTTTRFGHWLGDSRNSPRRLPTLPTTTWQEKRPWQGHKVAPPGRPLAPASCTRMRNSWASCPPSPPRSSSALCPRRTDRLPCTTHVVA